MSELLNVAIVGVGRMGKVHLRHLVFDERVDIKYLVDLPDYHNTIQSLVTKYRLKNAKILSPEDIDQVVLDRSVSAVFVCTLVNAKADIMRKMFPAGKHIFCEKPISLKTEVVEECYELAKKAGKVLQCGFDKRFDDSVRSMYNKIRRGEIGTLRMIKLTARELYSLVPSKEYITNAGGIFADTVIHEFDLLTWLAGERPHELFVYGNAYSPLYRSIDDIDGVSIILKFPSGLMGFVENFRGTNYGYDQRFEVLGSDGLLIVQNPMTSQAECWDSKGQLKGTVWQDGISRYTEAYRIEVMHFLDVITGKAECDVKGDDVIYVSKLIVSAEESFRTGKPVGTQ